VGGAEKAEPKLEANAMPEGKTQFQPKPVPRMQAVPLPSEQVSFQRDGAEVARYHYGASLRRPFLYPILGPAGRSLTRMGHPHDPVGHGHHDSVWTSHNDVDGTDFWSNGGPGTIVHLRVEKLEDGDDRAALTVRNAWTGKGDVVLLNERRTVAVHPLEKREWLLVVDLELEANGKDVTLGKTPFGVFSVRMAKTIGVHDGGGMIRNSEGGVNEEGVFWKRARWVDYSGLIAPDTVEGITLLDHPANPNHPSFFHVRNDGWMGASLTLDGPRTLQPGQPLRLRYGLYVHGGLPKAEVINARWEAFAKLALAKAEERK
jgi:hypothetical protein